MTEIFDFDLHQQIPLARISNVVTVYKINVFLSIFVKRDYELPRGNAFFYFRQNPFNFIERVILIIVRTHLSSLP